MTAAARREYRIFTVADLRDWLDRCPSQAIVRVRVTDDTTAHVTPVLSEWRGVTYLIFEPT